MYGIIARVTGFDRTTKSDARTFGQVSDSDDRPVFTPTDMVMGPRGEFAVDSPRKLFSQMRETGLLSEYSKGKVALEQHEDFWFVIDKNKYHPLFVIMPAIEPENLPGYDRSLCSLIHEALLESAKLVGVDVSEFTGLDEHATYGDLYDDDEDYDDEY